MSSPASFTTAYRNKRGVIEEMTVWHDKEYVYSLCARLNREAVNEDTETPEAVYMVQRHGSGAGIDIWKIAVYEIIEVNTNDSFRNMSLEFLLY